MTLLDAVSGILDTNHVRSALIGAAALALHGVSRSTFDQDLLVTEHRVLDAEFWVPLGDSTAVEIRRGDDADPLAGVVRIERAGDRPVDIIVGRFEWQASMLARADRVPGVDQPVTVVRAADLVLLKLYAGGSQDRWDIEQLLAADGDHAIRSEVETRISALPSRCATMWTLIREQ